MKSPHSNYPHRTFLLPILLITILFSQGISAQCRYEACSEAYSKERFQGAHSREYCLPLNRYRLCLETMTQHCKGALYYHSDSKIVSELMLKYKCEDLLNEEELAGGDTNSTFFDEDSLDSQKDQCEYIGDTTPSHCVLFGDPHLKTFRGEFMTCRIQKAWPLLSNPYMAVQVTNELVDPENEATATTKVTVIIKSHEQCASEKTYEASTEALPKAFMDGSTFSGIGTRNNHPVMIREELPGTYAIISIRYINATIGIRKIGRYLTVTATLPRELLETNRSEPGDMQLCSEGCPMSERLQPTVDANKKKAMSHEKALKLCQEFNMTDYYLDSCVFDLVTTGDKSFIAAARAAHADLWIQDPKTAYHTLQNCTKWPCQASYSKSSICRCDLMNVLIVMFMLFILTRWNRLNLISR